MLTGGIPIGSLFGVSLRLHYSWFVVFALVTWALSANYFPSVFPDWSLGLYILAGAITSLLFFASVLAHELMHSIVGNALGIPIRQITLFIFGGVAQMSEEPKRPKDEFRMAIAGPMTSLVIGGAFWGLFFLSSGRWEFGTAVAWWLGLINVFLAIFNLIPGFPMDGGRVLRSILWWRSKNLRSATRIASNVGRAVGLFFIFGGVFLVFQGLWLNGIWFAMIGWFLMNAAVGSYRQISLQEALRGHTASEVMTSDCPTVDPDLTVDRLVNDQILTQGRRCFPVASDGRVMGLVTLHNVKAVPRDLWPMRTMRQTMTPFDQLKSVPPTEDLSSVLKVMTQSDINQVLVVDDGSIVGVIGRDNLLGFINIRSELGV